MVWNFILIVLILLFLIGFVIYRLRDPQGNRPKSKGRIHPERFAIPSLIEEVKKSINDYTGSDIYDLALDEEDFERRQRMRNELKRALKGCSTGNIFDKIYVKEFILDRLLKECGLSD
jgi:pilus assembly protein CpaF